MWRVLALYDVCLCLGSGLQIGAEVASVAVALAAVVGQ